MTRLRVCSCDAVEQGVAKLARIPAYRIKITLTSIKPPVWRRVVLPGAWHLGKVHDAVQTAMGWTDSHLHRFRTGRDHSGRKVRRHNDGDARHRPEQKIPQHVHLSREVAEPDVHQVNSPSILA